MIPPARPPNVGLLMNFPAGESRRKINGKSFLSCFAFTAGRLCGECVCVLSDVIGFDFSWIEGLDKFKIAFFYNIVFYYVKVKKIESLFIRTF